MTRPSDPLAQYRAGMLGMITGYMRSQAIYVAAKLGIADQLVAGPRPVADIAAKTGAHAPTLYRLLRALASEGIFRELNAGTFELTPMAELLRSDIPDSMRVWAIMFNEEQFHAWSGLLASVQTGEIAFDRIYGEGYFDWLGKHPDASRTFHQAMTTGSAQTGPALVREYDFTPFDVIADIGGGNGHLLRTILTANPHARGILFDLPHVVGDTATESELHDVADRCDVVGGSFFEDVPGGVDLYVLRAILHDWDDRRCTTILRNCRRAMNRGGRVLVLEGLVAPANEPDFRKWMDLQVLALLGGRERTEAEFRRLLAEAGFAMTRVIPLTADHSAIEATPA